MDTIIKVVVRVKVVQDSSDSTIALSYFCFFSFSFFSGYFLIMGLLRGTSLRCLLIPLHRFVDFSIFLYLVALSGICVPSCLGSSFPSVCHLISKIIIGQNTLIHGATKIKCLIASQRCWFCGWPIHLFSCEILISRSLCPRGGSVFV